MPGNIETEIVFYVRVSNPEGLLKANHIEEHVQLETRLLNGNKVRVRKTTSNNKTNFVLTFKKKQNKDNNLVSESLEYNSNVTEEVFNNFEYISEQKIIKTRYTFLNKSISLVIDGQINPIVFDDIKFEVDVFKTYGKPSEYAKIDIEVQDILKKIKTDYPELETINFKVKASQLPFKPVDTIYIPNATDEQKELINKLWDTEFSIKNN